MEHSTDVLNGAFEVPGGSGIRSDGTFYWRQDAACYVEVYRLGVPSQFVEHCKAAGFKAPALSSPEVIEVDAYLAKLFGMRIQRTGP
jgi:hypothetical protein